MPAQHKAHGSRHCTAKAITHACDWLRRQTWAGQKFRVFLSSVVVSLVGSRLEYMKPCFKKIKGLAHSFNPSLLQRQADLHEFETGLVYIVSFRLVKLHSETLSRSGGEGEEEEESQS